MKATAALKAADRNPYSWNMELYEYPDAAAMRDALPGAASACRRRAACHRTAHAVLLERHGTHQRR